jgi:hypothetical protein
MGKTMLFAPTQTTNLSYRSWPNSMSDLCSLDQPDHSFRAYAVSIEEMTVAAKGAGMASCEEEMEYDLYHQ